MPWVASTVRRRPEAVTEVPAVDVVDKLTMCFNGAIRAWQRVPFKLVKRGYETRVTLADYDNFTGLVFDPMDALCAPWQQMQPEDMIR